MVLDKWIEGMLHLFAPQINWLVQQRDVQIKQSTSDNPYLDNSLEELSSLDINLASQVQWVMRGCLAVLLVTLGSKAVAANCANS